MHPEFAAWHAAYTGAGGIIHRTAVPLATVAAKNNEARKASGRRRRKKDIKGFAERGETTVCIIDLLSQDAPPMRRVCRRAILHHRACHRRGDRGKL
jgi:hypothetical protein